MKLLFDREKSARNSEWKVLKIKRVLDTPITDGPHETPELLDVGIPFLSAESVKKGKLDFNFKRGYISRINHEKYIKKCKPRRDDICMVKSGATTGNVAMIETDEEFSIWSPLALIRADKAKLIPKFLYFFMDSPAFREQVENSWSFGTQQNIGMKVIENLFISVPPLNVQKKIIQFLENEVVQIDKLIEMKELKISLLEQQRQSVITEVVTKGLNPNVKMKDSGIEWIGEIPEHWFLKKVKFLLKPGSEGIKIGPFGSSLKLEQMVDKGYKVYGQENLIKDDFSVGEKFIDNKTYDLLKNYAITENDVLVSMMGTIGKCKVVSKHIEEGIMDSHLIRMRFHPTYIVSEYVALVISNSNYISHQFKLNSKGTIMSGLNSGIIKSLIVAVPPLKEQEEILESLNLKLKEIKNMTSVVKLQIEKLKEYRQSLIYEAVTGKIDVRDMELD